MVLFSPQNYYLFRPLSISYPKRKKLSIVAHRSNNCSILHGRGALHDIVFFFLIDYYCSYYTIIIVARLSSYVRKQQQQQHTPPFLWIFPPFSSPPRPPRLLSPLSLSPSFYLASFLSFPFLSFERSSKDLGRPRGESETVCSAGTHEVRKEASQVIARPTGR